MMSGRLNRLLSIDKYTLYNTLLFFDLQSPVIILMAIQ